MSIADEFKALLGELNLSYAEAAALLGTSKGNLGSTVSRGVEKTLVGWSTVLREAFGANAVGAANDLQTKSANDLPIANDLPSSPNRNANGVLVARCLGLTVIEKSAERGHPEWDLMSDGFARGYRFVRDGVPEDDDILMRRRYRTPAAFRRQGEKMGLDETGIRKHIEKKMQAIEPGYRCAVVGKPVSGESQEKEK